MPSAVSEHNPTDAQSLAHSLAPDSVLFIGERGSFSPGETISVSSPNTYTSQGKCSCPRPPTVGREPTDWERWYFRSEFCCVHGDADLSANASWIAKFDEFDSESCGDSVCGSSDVSTLDRAVVRDTQGQARAHRPTRECEHESGCA